MVKFIDSTVICRIIFGSNWWYFIVAMVTVIAIEPVVQNDVAPFEYLS